MLTANERIKCTGLMGFIGMKLGYGETVWVLSMLSAAKEPIEGMVDMDEMDLTSAESKATYK